jgi:hypothetical protein
LPINSSEPALLNGLNTKTTLLLSFQFENFSLNDFKFIEIFPFGVKFLNSVILLPSFTFKSTSIVEVANEEYSYVKSMFKSENEGTSIVSANVISVIDGKSFTAVNVIKADTESPVPYFVLSATNTIFLVPYTSEKSFLKYKVMNPAEDGTNSVSALPSTYTLTLSVLDVLKGIDISLSTSESFTCTLY